MLMMEDSAVRILCGFSLAAPAPVPKQEGGVNCRTGSMWGNPELGQLCGTRPPLGI